MPDGAAGTRIFYPLATTGGGLCAPSLLATLHQGRVPEEIIVSIEFLLTSLIVVASPGTGVLYTLSAGLSRGARASIIAAFNRAQASPNPASIR